MSENLIEQIFALPGKHRTLEQNNYLFHQGDPVKAVFVVEEGLIELTRHQLNGTVIVLQRARRLTLLAEASVYSENYHCDAVVKSSSTIFELPKKLFFEQLCRNVDFSNTWASHLSREVQSARYRSEILSRKTVAERLDGWLVWKGGDLPDKGQWKDLAEQIGVSPEALYRELAKRRSQIVGR